MEPAEPRPLPPPDPDAPPRLTARTLGGLEGLLAAEICGLGGDVLAVGRRTVEFAGSTEVLYRSVLESRMAIRVLEPLGRFAVDSPEAMHAAINAIDWREHFSRDDTLRVDAVIHDTFLTNSLYAAQLVKDAVVDCLRTRAGWRPDVRRRGASQRLAVHLVGTTATLYRDAAGRSLHQRGWRRVTGEAPLSEVLAAGILALAGWRPDGETGQSMAVIDPMCGSGTFLIEAATAAARIAPGLVRARRGDHGFLRFRDCDRDLAGRIIAQLEGRVVEPRGLFVGSDLDPAMAAAAAANAAAAGVGDCLRLTTEGFDAVEPPAEAGLVVTNPPYGERLPAAREGMIFKRLGDWLFSRFGGWQAAVLAPDTPAARRFSLKPRLRLPLTNGSIRCRLLVADIRRRPPPPASSQPAAATAGAAARGFREQAGDFRRRLAKRFRHLSRWARRQGIEAYRLYDRDIPEIPLAIDWYGGWLHAAEYDRPHGRTDLEHAVWLARLLEEAAAELGVPPAKAFLKARRRQRGGGQYDKLDERQEIHTVREGPLVYEVNLSDYVDTGLFLDHRATRRLVGDEAAGKRVLNLFCYTGSFTVAAAAGGARETVSVDLSNTYLDWAGRNLAANRIAPATHRLVRDEARAFLHHHGRRGEAAFDLAVVDPPTFSRSARSPEPWSVQDDHAGLLELLADRLVPGGVVYFSSNFRRFRLDEQRLAAHYAIREITRQTLPEDFRNRRIHRTWRLVNRPVQAGISGM